MERSLVTTRIVLLITAIVVAFQIIPEIFSTLLVIMVALMFATALSPWVDFLERHRVKRGIAVVLISAGFLALLAAFGVALVPVVADQVRSLIDRFPEARAEVVQFLRDQGATRPANQLARFELGQLVPPQAIGDAGTGIIGLVSTFVSLGLLTCYFLVDAHRIKRLVFYILPHRHHDDARYLMRALQKVVGGFIRGQFTISLCILVFVFVLLTALRVPNALALAVFAFLGDMVPIIGVYVIVVPVAAAALDVSITTAVIVSAAIIVYTQFENNILVPRVYSSTLNLPPSAIFVGILIGGTLLGLAGALLALPATATTAVLIRYWHDRREGKIPGVEPETPAPLVSAEPAR